MKGKHNFSDVLLNSIYKIKERYLKNKFQKTLAIFCLFLFMSKFSFSQNSDRAKLLEKIQSSVVIDANKLKDSIAFYSFSIRIEFKRVKNNIVVDKISPNDSIGFIILVNYESLKNLNYTSLIHSTKTVLVIPIGVIVKNDNSKKIQVHKILVEDFSKKINNLFDYNPIKKNHIENYKYIQPFIVYVDKTIYD